MHFRFDDVNHSPRGQKEKEKEAEIKRCTQSRTETDMDGRGSERDWKGRGREGERDGGDRMGRDLRQTDAGIRGWRWRCPRCDCAWAT